ncbi:GNAT family N-acetyltransferase [Roseibium alexandrii]
MVRISGPLDDDLEFRPAARSDLDAVYDISLLTGNAGRDATSLYVDPKLMGHIYAAPYLILDGTIGYVVENQKQVLGFVLGATNTRDFEAQLEDRWWPELRRDYPWPGQVQGELTADQKRIHMIHRPDVVPERVVQTFPAHLHMNLLPEVQGKGVGTALLNVWLDAARNASVSGVHVRVNAKNTSGFAFWKSRGFQPLLTQKSMGSAGTIWCGLQVGVS